MVALFGSMIPARSSGSLSARTQLRADLDAEAIERVRRLRKLRNLDAHWESIDPRDLDRGYLDATALLEGFGRWRRATGLSTAPTVRLPTRASSGAVEEPEQPPAAKPERSAHRRPASAPPTPTAPAAERATPRSAAPPLRPTRDFEDHSRPWGIVETVIAGRLHPRSREVRSALSPYKASPIDWEECPSLEAADMADRYANAWALTLTVRDVVFQGCMEHAFTAIDRSSDPVDVVGVVKALRMPSGEVVETAGHRIATLLAAQANDRGPRLIGIVARIPIEIPPDLPDLRRAALVAAAARLRAEATGPLVRADLELALADAFLAAGAIEEAVAAVRCCDQTLRASGNVPLENPRFGLAAVEALLAAGGWRRAGEFARRIVASRAGGPFELPVVVALLAARATEPSEDPVLRDHLKTVWSGLSKIDRIAAARSFRALAPRLTESGADPVRIENAVKRLAREYQRRA